MARLRFFAVRHTAKQALLLIAFLRTFAPFSQLLTLMVVTGHFNVRVPVPEIGYVMVFEIVVAGATWHRLRYPWPVSDLELFLHAQLDIAMFALMLYFTGGGSNPFAPLFVLPMAIVALVLRPRWVWLTALTTMVCYAYLRWNHVPMYHPAGETEVYELHEDGMIVNYMFTAALLAYFVSRMSSETRRHQRVVAELRDAQMRNESVVSIGAMAAGYAHELSTPLATMAVVITELRRAHGGDAALQADLRVLDEQVGSCKTIVSNLAAAAGQRRAESAAAAPLDAFIESIVERVRSLHTGASVSLTVDRATPPPLIVAEETLRQTITNLVENAVRASPSDVKVSVTWRDGELRVQVVDRGPGFSDELLERIGRQLVTTRPPGEGMGLGLMLGLVTLDRLDGRLELSNLPSGGACAVVKIPLRKLAIEQ